MKFVYPYKKKSDTFEIYHSIRWLYLAHPDAEIYLIGDRPDIDLPFIHIPYQSHLSNSGCEVTDKIMTFCELIGDEFILMNDDFFVTDKFQFDKVMRYDYLHINPSHSRSYQQACENTIDWLKSNHLELVNYECHQPVLIQSCRFIDLFQSVDFRSHNHLLKSMYFNTWPMRSYEGSNLKFGYSLVKAKEALNQFGSFSSSDTFLSAENRYFISMYSSSAVQIPSAGCQLCQTQAPQLD